MEEPIRPVGPRLISGTSRKSTKTFFTKVSSLYLMSHNSDEWLGIESNPDVLNEFASKMGLDVTKYCFGDVWVSTIEITSVTLVRVWMMNCWLASLNQSSL